MSCDRCNKPVRPGDLRVYVNGTDMEHVCIDCLTTHEYIVQTDTGRNISYHAPDMQTAAKYAQRAGHTVVDVLTLGHFQSLQK